MYLSSHFQSRRDAIARLPQFFGLPNCRSLILVQRQSGGASTYLEIEPRPIIQEVSPNLAAVYEKVEGIQIELSDFQAQVSRKYSRSQIIGRGISYLIDAQLVDGKPVGGFEADILPGMNLLERDLHWELILRRRP